AGASGLASLGGAGRRWRRRLGLLLARLTDPWRNPPEVPLIRRSGLFDPDYYLRHNAGIAPEAADDPVRHYVLVGARAGYDPNPLAHFLAAGGREGKKPHPLFDPSYYLARSPGAAASGQSPLAHYLAAGEKEGRDPSPYFDVAYYRSAHGHLLPTAGGAASLL